jgi:XTP/dITP diphosphohydrolase
VGSAFPTTLATTSRIKKEEWDAISEKLSAGSDAPRFTVLEAKPNLIEIQSIEVVNVIVTKALDALRKLGRPVLIEDSSYEIAALGNYPGALYSSTEKTITNAGLCKLMEGKEDRRVKMKIGVGFADEQGENVHVLVGELLGRIPSEPQGPDNFGYDNILIPDGFELTLAQLGPDQKNEISARRLAIGKLLKGEWEVHSASESPLYLN